MQCYLVGGAVRDRLLGYPYSERDWVVVGATPQQMLDQGFRPVGRDFPVFLHPDSQEEYALARTERKSGHGYHGFSVYAAPSVTLEEDLARRDLTINAIAESADGRLVDPYGGQQDIQQRLLRHVSDAFVEDPLRVLRVARFASRYAHLGFKVAPETQELMVGITASGELEHLAPERVWKELERSLAERSPQVFFEVLADCGARDIWMPELHAVRRSTWQALARAGTADPTVPVPLRFALLATDLEVDAVNRLCQRLKVPNEIRDLARLAATASAAMERTAEVAADARQVLELLDMADAWRRPARLEQLAETLSLRDPSDRWPQRLRMAGLACRNIDQRAILAQGLSGKAIGEALHRERLATIGKLLNGSMQRDG